MKILNILLVIIILLIIIFGVALVLFNKCDKEYNKWDRSKHFTGKMHSYDVYHKTPHSQYKIIKTSERYDDKYFEYLEHIQESRDKTFMKGRVFLTEK